MGLIEETQGSFLTLITKSSGNVGDPALRRLVGCARDECHRVLESFDGAIWVNRA